MLRQLSLTSDCTTIIPQLPRWKKKEKWSASQRRLYENHVHFHCFNRHNYSFFPSLCCHILFCQKFLSLFQSAGIKWCFITLDHLSDIEYLRTNDFQVLLLCVKNSTPRRALCQTSTQQLGLSTKGAPLCCWGERWQVPLRCGCLKIKRSSVVCREPSVSVIALSRQLSGKLEGPN